MCCFSRDVTSVSNTRIFARGDDAHQLLVYNMNLQASEPLAMILPLPIAAGAGEADVKFIDLHDYAGFFDDLEKGFYVPAHEIPTNARSAAAVDVMIPVHSVGSFDASFVPTLADFSRLDARFRLPPHTWDKIPAYKTYGFAVFKLKPDAHEFHPMAFRFKRADRTRLFFPTVHIHDEKVHGSAMFDHALYYQGPSAQPSWQASHAPADAFMSVPLTKGIIVGNQHAFKKRLWGSLQNRDTWVPAT
jgi:hypothetical protein